MKILNYLFIVLLTLILFSCSKVSEPVKKIGIGSSILNYDSDERGESLVIPPDLTAPSSKGIFADKKAIIETDIVLRNSKVEVKRDQYRRWLVLDLPPSEVFSLSKEFLRSFGFIIEYENKRIGILETDYLEKETIVPDKALGQIRAGLAKVLNTSYGMPTADKYRIRVEPLSNPNQSELYLTLSSIGEVVSGDMRLWQPQEKNLELETEMLLSLMVFLGSEKAAATKKIQDINEVSNPSIEIITSGIGYATMAFPYDRDESWRYLGWALDELGIDIEDRDIDDASFFIKVSPKGFFSKLIGAAGSIKTYQLFVKQIDKSKTYIYFVDLSGENDQASMKYSFELFNNILSKF
jgi:outer membrane protein assembly factor BamC